MKKTRRLQRTGTGTSLTTWITSGSWSKRKPRKLAITSSARRWRGMNRGVRRRSRNSRFLKGNKERKNRKRKNNKSRRLLRINRRLLPRPSLWRSRFWIMREPISQRQAKKREARLLERPRHPRARLQRNPKVIRHRHRNRKMSTKMHSILMWNNQRIKVKGSRPALRRAPASLHQHPEPVLKRETVHRQLQVEDHNKNRHKIATSLINNKSNRIGRCNIHFCNVLSS